MRVGDWLEGLEFEWIQGSPDCRVEDVVYDSRKAGPGTVFVCIRGTKTDSHGYLPQVIQAGTQVVVVERRIPLPPDVTGILVKDGRRALALLSAARFGRPSEKMVTVGVTGTKGKTTTTHMIKAVLEAAGKRVGMIGTNGVAIGGEVFPTQNTTPESYRLQQYFDQMVKAGCEYMIMEVSSQGIKMHRTDGILFDYGIFTNISPDHIGPDEHEDFAEYLYYKSRLFGGCRTGLVNRDDEHYGEIVRDASCRVFSYGLEQEADFMAKDVRYVSGSGCGDESRTGRGADGFVGLEFSVEGRLSMEVRANIPGHFNAYNALAAVSVCSLMGLSAQQIGHGLEHLRIDGRMEIVHSSGRLTVIVDYAHNAVSMESLLKTLRDYHPKRLVVVFGCGGNRSRDRRYSMGEIGGRLADLCVITADNSRYEKVEDILDDIKIGLSGTGGEYVEIPDRREAIFHAILHSRPGDMVAVVGKGHEDYQEIAGVRHPFLDRMVVEEAIKLLDERQG